MYVLCFQGVWHNAKLCHTPYKCDDMDGMLK